MSDVASPAAVLSPTAMPAKAVQPPSVRSVVLVILDGVGCREDAPDNAATRAATPRWHELVASCPHTTLDASEQRVGLPEGQVGNSEVGHLNIGAGRIVHQYYTRIDLAISEHEFERNPALSAAVTAAAGAGKTLHVLGLLSPGGVHSHERQIAAMVEMAAKGGAPRIAVHAFLDGRDTLPKAAAASIDAMEEVCAAHPQARIASICGRYYAMDRDRRWDRVATAYALVVDGDAPHQAPTARDALAAAYARGETDEFVSPTAVIGRDGGPVRMDDGDAVVFMNFRADRARELTRALTDPAFDGFARRRVPQRATFVCLTRYGDEFAHLPVAFAPTVVEDGFGDYLARLGLRQLRIAETEKYAHVTYFFNGGREAPFPGEDRVLVPSPQVATYDLAPEMSAFEVTDRLVEVIAARRYDAIVCNFANGDMVGHTGNFDAARRAIEVLDACLGRVVAAARAAGAEVLITADHGNAEQMKDPVGGGPHTAHTRNLVPLVYVGRPATCAAGGSLQDIAPTLLAMMGLPKPAPMTGRTLLVF